MKLICINCPRGCHLEVYNHDGTITVKGNSCPRGEQYAINEITNPLRTVTTTVAIESEKYDRLPVITSTPIPKAKTIDICRALKEIKVKAPIKMGDIIVSNVLGLDADIIASKSIEK